MRRLIEHKSLLLGILIGVLLLGISLPTFAQRTTANVIGTVTDETGAVLPGATVAITNVDTGVSKTTFANEVGVFNFGDLRVGPYEMTTELDGFKTAVVKDITLNVGDIREIDFTLSLGEITEEIVTVASSVVVETIGGEVANLINGEQIRELPLNGRNFTQLAILMPGVSTGENFDTKNKGLLTGVDMSISGGAATGNLWTVDGANNNDVGSNRTVLIYPSVDAIEEFKIHRNSYGAEFGGASGGQINIVTRGGTNDLHGSAFAFARDDAFNESNFFLSRAGQPKEPLSREDFGYTLGGPIVKDKLHFFVSQEWNQETRGVVRSGFVPTEAERRGDFSGPGISGCTPGAPIDPLTGEPFPGNVIPGDRLSEAGSTFLELYPTPNTTPVAGSCLNWVESVSTPIDWRQDNIRFDYSVTDSTRIMVRFTQDTWENGAPNAGEANGLWGDDQFPAVDSTWDQEGISFVTQLNQTIGNSAINTVQFSYSGNEIQINRGGRNAGLNSQINAEIPAIFEGDKTGGEDRSHPVFWGAQGYAPLWNIAPWQNQQDLITFKDDYQQVFGKHWIKAGVLYSDNAKDEFIGGASAFESPQFWGGAGINGWGATSGNILADFLIRDMTFGFSENSFEPDPELRWEDFEIYISDSWQATANLTFDFGLRYSRFENPFAVSDQVASFVPELFDPALGGDPCNGLILPPGSTACSDAGFQGGTIGPNRSLVEQDDDNIAPRLGLAWDVKGDGNTLIRAGLGQFYQRERVNIQLELAGSPPFTSQRNGIRTLDDPSEPCGGCFGVNDGVPTRGILLDNPTPYNWQWNLTWEQRLSPQSTIELSYVGSRGVHLTRRGDINQVAPGDGNGNGVSDRLDYVRGVGDPGALGALRPFSVFGDAQILYWVNDGVSDYNALQTHYTLRFGRGSQFQASYTLSDLRANDPLTDSGAGTFPGQIADFSNPSLDRGEAGFNREHSFSASLLYNLPTLENKGGVLEAIFGHWQLGAIVQAASGVPLTVTIGGLPGGLNGLSGTGFTDNERPNRVAGEPCRASGGPTEQWLNPNAFTLNGFELGSFGDSPPGVCHGPEFFQVDFSLYKNIRISRRFSGQFRIEVFNLFDRENFIAVDTTLDPLSVTLDGPLEEATRVVDSTLPASFGQAARVRDPRQIQFGFKLLW